MAGQRLVGLDFGSKAIKAVELSAQGRDELAMQRFGMVEVPNEQSRGEKLCQLVDTMRLRGSRVATSVAGRSVIVRYITMRQMPDDELKHNIRFEADKYIPFGMEEIVVDCQRLHAVAETEMRVVLVAVKRAFIEEHVRLMDQAGLRPVVVDVDALALGNAFEMNTPAADEDANRVVAVIEIGAGSTNIDMLDGLSTCWSRELFVAGDQFTEHIARDLGLDYAEVERLKLDAQGREEEIREAVAPVLDDLRNEIMLTFDFFESEMDKEVEALYFCGGSALLPGLVDYFGEVFQKPAKLWDPVAGLTLKLSPVDADVLKQRRFQAAVAIGLAGRAMMD